MLRHIAVVILLGVLLSCSAQRTVVKKSVSNPVPQPIAQHNYDNLPWMREKVLPTLALEDIGSDKIQAFYGQELSAKALDAVKILEQKSGKKWLVYNQSQFVEGTEAALIRETDIGREDCKPPIKPPENKTIKTPNRLLLKQQAQNFLNNHIDIFQINGELHISDQVIDYAAVRGTRLNDASYGVNFQQTFHGLPVFGYGGEVFFGFVDGRYSVCSVQATTNDLPIDIPLKPILSKEDAIRIAKADMLKDKNKYLSGLKNTKKNLDKWQDTEPGKSIVPILKDSIQDFALNQPFKPGIIDLGIYFTKQHYVLAYRLLLGIKGYKGAKHYFVDAKIGKIIFLQDNLYSHKNMPRCGNIPTTFDDSQSEKEITLDCRKEGRNDPVICY